MQGRARKPQRSTAAGEHRTGEDAAKRTLVPNPARAMRRLRGGSDGQMKCALNGRQRMERDDVIPTQATSRAGAARLSCTLGATRHCSTVGEPKAIVVFVTGSVPRQPIFRVFEVPGLTSEIRCTILYGYKGYPLSTKFPHAEISGLARRFLRDLAVDNQVCLNGPFDLASAVAQDNVRNHPRWQTILQTGSACEDSRRPQ